MIDSDGNLISLKGKDGKNGDKGDKGDKGDTGKDGLDAPVNYHLELSNDMDQVYVTNDFYPVTKQILTTSVSLYKDDILQSITNNTEDNYWELSCNTIDGISPNINNNKIKISLDTSLNLSDYQ